MKKTDLKTIAAELRAVRSNQPRAKLQQAREQAARVMAAGQNSPGRLVRSSNGESNKT